MNTIEDIRILAQAAYEAHELPAGMIIDDQDGFDIEDNGSNVELSRKVYFYSEHDEEDENSLIGYFNVRVDAATMDLSEAYFIASGGGVLVGEFTDESRREAYAAAGVEDPRALNELVGHG
ncbi:hypothetical protein G6L37_06545 [Agrobacterium rubi]|nr:hypothetical protein [Agrobacterium rubi]NTF25022.1 hypothetical protein [Agrobacterium rubi]